MELASPIKLGEIFLYFMVNINFGLSNFAIILFSKKYVYVFKSVSLLKYNYTLFSLRKI
jgi:hypothetical protein